MNLSLPGTPIIWELSLPGLQFTNGLWIGVRINLIPKIFWFWFWISKLWFWCCWHNMDQNFPQIFILMFIFQILILISKSRPWIQKTRLIAGRLTFCPFHRQWFRSWKCGCSWMSHFWQMLSLRNHVQALFLFPSLSNPKNFPPTNVMCVKKNQCYSAKTPKQIWLRR